MRYSRATRLGLAWVLGSTIAALASGCATPGDPTLTTGPSVPVADLDCRVTGPPGPGDLPPADGTEIAADDLGGGRWRLCITDPAPASVEGTAWCRWDADRSAVDEISGLPVTAGTVAYDAFISFPGSAFEVHLENQAEGGVTTNYVPRFDLPEMDVEEGRIAGVGPFDVVRVAEEGEDPQGTPSGLIGRLRWICGVPPPG